MAGYGNCEGESAQVRRTISFAARVFARDNQGNTVQVQNAPDAQLIGFRRPKGPAEGVMVDDTAYSFGWRVMIPRSVATEFWRRSVGELRGTTNAGPFFGYPPGEVKFDDWSGTARAGTGLDGQQEPDYRVDLQFSRRPSAASLNVGGITVPNVGGWEYIDVDDVAFITDDEGRIFPRAERVKVHQVFPSANWGPLSMLLGV